MQTRLKEKNVSAVMRAGQMRETCETQVKGEPGLNNLDRRESAAPFIANRSFPSTSWDDPRLAPTPVALLMDFLCDLCETSALSLR